MFDRSVDIVMCPSSHASSVKYAWFGCGKYPFQWFPCFVVCFHCLQDFNLSVGETVNEVPNSEGRTKV